jgi:hypothetical protein
VISTDNVIDMMSDSEQENNDHQPHKSLWDGVVTLTQTGYKRAQTVPFPHEKARYHQRWEDSQLQEQFAPRV